MKSFLIKEKQPIIKWGQLPNNTFFKGDIPENYFLAISPSEGYVVIDVDKHNDINGFDNVPIEIFKELEQTLNYVTKNLGKHYWIKYSGEKYLANKTSGLGIDLRTHKGYVIWYPKEDFNKQKVLIKESSLALNKWLEHLFSYKKYEKTK